MWEKLKKILLVVFVVLFVAVSVGAIWLWISKGADSKRIADLENTASKYAEQNKQLAETNSRLEQSIIERSRTIGQLQEAISGAGGDIQDALKTVDRLERLASQIGN